MLLAIDAGNTNTLFAIYDGDELRGQWRIATNGQRTADEYLVWLSQLLMLEGIDLKSIDAAIIATVVPQALFNLRQLCHRLTNKEPMVVGDASVDLGIEIRLDDKGSVGADRLANAVGAHQKYRGALLVLDFGTATTLDVVAADGAYEGGIIAPGVNLSIEALHMAAAKLPHIAVERPQAIIGKNTVDAMKSGVFWGYIGLIEGLVGHAKAEYEKPLTVVATGGLSRLFRHSTPVIEHVDDDLTITGLLYIYKRNVDALRQAAQ